MNNGCKLYLAEHGGGIPDKQSHFDFMINYSDKYLSWAKEKNKKSLQMPADKFLLKPRYINKNKINNVTIIEPIFEKHIYTLSSRSISSLYIEHIKQINLFYKNLSKDVQRKILIKLSPIREIYSENFYEFVNKSKKTLTDMNYYQAILNSKIIICTYPMTTLSEVVMSGTPFILFYPEEIYRRFNKENNQLIKKMKNSKLLFTDPVLAAKHLRNVYKNPYTWWSTKKVQQTIFFINNFV